MWVVKNYIDIYAAGQGPVIRRVSGIGITECFPVPAGIREVPRDHMAQVNAPE